MKKKIKKEKEEAYLVLEGSVYMETRKGKKVTREPLDGEVVLKCVLSVIESGLRLKK